MVESQTGAPPSEMVREPVVLALTGATGAVGGRVARLCVASGMPVRLLVRDAARAPSLPSAAVRVFGGYGSGDAVEALAGARLLFMVSASESPTRLREHLDFVDAATAAGVEQVVYTSFQGAAPDATFTLARDHWATEEHIRASGMTWTFLRDSLYADFIPRLVGPDGVIRGPARDGRVAAVAQADIARCAQAVLADPAPHRGRTYDLTGPAAFTLAEVAEVLTDVLGRPVSFHDETLEEARASRAHWNPPPWQLDAWISTYLAIAAGELSHVSDAVRRLTGREPLGLADLLAGGAGETGGTGG